MKRRLYLDFDLLIEPAGQGGYRAKVLRSPAGETAGQPFTSPFSELELDNFYLRIGAARGASMRGEQPTEAEAVTSFGSRLFDAVFQHELREALVSSRSQAESQNSGLRLRLRLTDCPELAELPWEYLFDHHERRFLALSEWTPVVRYLDVRGAITPLPVNPPLRILVHIASPSDLRALDVEKEWAKIQDALAPLESSGRVRVDRVRPRGTMADLQKQLRRATAEDAGYHVFHFIGHGQFDTRSGSGVLAFEKPSGRVHEVAAEDIGALLHDHRTLRLAVLNACEGARGNRTDPYAGTAQGLMRQGIPAVVAMQFPISDTAAIDFAESLYESVADGYPLDASVAEARKAIKNEPNAIEWGTPVLYLRAPDGRIFDLPEDASPRRRPDTPRRPTVTADQPDAGLSIDQDPDWPTALDAYFTQHWDVAVELMTKALDRHPGEPRVITRLEDARAKRDLSSWYADGAAAAARHDWADAVRAYERVCTTDPDYKDSKALLADAKWQGQRSQLIDDLVRLGRSSKWEAVLSAAEQLAELDPDTRDPDGLVTQAREALATRDLDARYARGLRELESGDWASALATFTSIEADRADYRQTLVLLNQVRQAQALHEKTARVAELQDSLRTAWGTDDWPSVAQLSAQLAEIDPSSADPDGLATEARARLLGLLTHDLRAVMAARSSHSESTTGQGPRRAIASVARPCTLSVGQWVRSVAFSPDGRLLATGSRRCVRVWDLENMAVLWMGKVGGWIDDVTSVAFSPDGTRLATASEDYTARIWDARTGEQTLQVAHDNQLSGVAFSPDGALLATASADKTARVWNASAGAQLLRVFHKAAVKSVAFSPDGITLATGSADETARIWDAGSGRLLCKVSHDGGVTGAVFSPNGTRLATASHDHTARVWDTSSGKQLLRLDHNHAVLSVAFSPKGTRLATASDQSAHVWQVRTGMQTHEVTHELPGIVNTVAFTPDGALLATGSSDKTVRIWRLT